MKKERRNKTIKARFTESENLRLKREADTAGISVSQLVRLRAIGKEKELSCHHRPTTIVHTADPELLRNIAKIGGNINQIARHLNTLNKKGELTGAEFLDALITLKSLEDDMHLLVEAFTYDD